MIDMLLRRISRIVCRRINMLQQLKRGWKTRSPYFGLSTIHVLHVIPSMRRGGRERQLAYIIDKSKGIDNHIVVFSETDKSYPLPGERVVKIAEGDNWHRTKELRRFIRYMNPDVIFAWDISSFVLTKLAIPFSKKPVINGSIRHGIFKKNAYGFFRALVAHFSKHIIANSRAGLKANGLQRGNVLYNGIDACPELGDEEKKCLRQRIIPQAQGAILITVANLLPIKDYSTTLSALASLKRKGYSFFYIIIGDGPLKPQIDRYVINNELSECVLLVGNIHNVDEYLSIADIMVHSSKGEGVSNAILEGMNHGLPIIASKVGGIPETVNCWNSLLFDVGNVTVLEDHIEKLLNNPELRNRMGQQSKDIIHERFSMDSMIHGYESQIRQLVLTQNKQAE